MPIAAMIFLSLLSASAQAATCSLAATAVAFGNYNAVLALPSDSSGTLTVTCQSGLLELVSYSITLSPGNSGNAAARRLQSGANQLTYNLYTDILRSNYWGSGAQALSSNLLITTLLTPFVANHPVYGRIPAGQSGAAAGSYSDVIQATITF